MTDLSGKSLGRYNLLERLGEGGMAVVYKAFDTRLETEVAVKVIRTEKLTEETKERTLRRFDHEAKVLARLTHPNIVTVTDYGEYEGNPYLVMPYLSGGTLKEQLSRPVAWEKAFHILAPIARGLEYAHQHNIIHRDVKSSNILMTDSGQPMLSDFGVAKILILDVSLDLTNVGMGIGTPAYMAPEQWTGKTTSQSDQYSLGVVLYEMLTGRKPYTAETPAAILLKQATEELPRPIKYAPNLPEAVEKILIKAMARDPKNRYEDMAAFARALENMEESAIIRGGDTPELSEKTTRTAAYKSTQLGSEAKKQASRFSFWYLVAGLAVFTFIGFSIKGNTILAPASAETGMATEILGITPSLTNAPSFITQKPFASLTPSEPQTPLQTVTPFYEIGSTTKGVDGMTLLFVPEGEFTMGSETGENDEKPIHRVNLASYWIDQTEVTNDMYSKCVAAKRCAPPGKKSSSTHSSYYGSLEYDNFPVIFVDWNMANAYCTWAGRRLPTEAEWEKAARGTDERTYPWGNSEPNSKLLNLYVGDTTPSGNYPDGASPYGALDMAGNVWEWVNDWYSDTYYEGSPSLNPMGPDLGNSRVLRGGSWYYGDSIVRSTYRNGLDPSYQSYYYGFRCAISP